MARKSRKAGIAAPCIIWRRGAMGSVGRKFGGGRGKGWSDGRRLWLVETLHGDDFVFGCERGHRAFGSTWFAAEDTFQVNDDTLCVTADVDRIDAARYGNLSA